MIDMIERGDIVVLSADVPEGVVEAKLRSRISNMAWLAIRGLIRREGCWRKVHDNPDMDAAVFVVKLTIICDRPPQADDEEDEDG